MQFAVGEETFSVTLAVTDAIDELILGIDWLSQNAAEWVITIGHRTGHRSVTVGRLSGAPPAAC